MLAVPCVERSRRQHSAKPTHFVVWPASNTIFICVKVAATQSCTPCNSLSMSEGVKLGSCSYSLFQRSICQRPFTGKPCACSNPYPVSQIHREQIMRTPSRRVPQCLSQPSLHRNSKPQVMTKANRQPQQQHFKIRLSVSSTRPLRWC